MKLGNVDNVTIAFGKYTNRACEQVCKLKKVNQENKSVGPKWYDTECRLKRAEAEKLGEMASNGTMNMQRALQVSGEYRAMKQWKRGNFVYKNNWKEAKQAFDSNRTAMWQILNKLNDNRNHGMGSASHDILDYFKKLSIPRSRHSLTMSMKIQQSNSMRNMTREPPKLKNELAWQILNREFDTVEISCVVDTPKRNKAHGLDLIPDEFVKYCKAVLMDDLCKLYGYMFDKSEFPDAWAELLY